MTCYPKPQEVGIHIPAHLNHECYQDGFSHALQGMNLTKREHLRRSFCEGYRAGKLYLRELRRQKGVIDFPVKAHFKLKSAA